MPKVGSASRATAPINPLAHVSGDTCTGTLISFLFNSRPRASRVGGSGRKGIWGGGGGDGGGGREIQNIAVGRRERWKREDWQV